MIRPAKIDKNAYLAVLSPPPPPPLPPPPCPPQPPAHLSNICSNDTVKKHFVVHILLQHYAFISYHRQIAIVSLSDIFQKSLKSHLHIVVKSRATRSFNIDVK